MTFTYKGPTQSTQDAVRFEIGDTIESSHLVEDDEIKYALAKEGTVLKAAARICEYLAARFAREGDFRGSTLQLSKNTVTAKYVMMANRLRARSISGDSFIIPHYETDADAEPKFKAGMHDNPEVDSDLDSDLKST